MTGLLPNVREHKAFHIHGHAHAVTQLDEFLHSRGEKQVTGIGVDENQPVFPSFNGTKMQSSQINKAVKSEWEKAGIYGPIHGSLLRKGAVTAVHRNHEKEASNLADLMAHKEDTAVKYYRLSEKAQASVMHRRHSTQ